MTHEYPQPYAGAYPQPQPYGGAYQQPYGGAYQQPYGGAYQQPYGGAYQQQWSPAPQPLPYGYPAAMPAPGYPYAPAGKAPGVVLIVFATLLSGILGLALVVNRTGTARRMGLPTRRYWLAWAIPLAVWLPLVIYINVFAGDPSCSC